MSENAQYLFAADGRDAGTLAERSAALWSELTLDETARLALKRDGLDVAGMRLSGPHPFGFEPAPDRAIAVTAYGSDKAAAETLLDLFRIYFLRRLGA